MKRAKWLWPGRHGGTLLALLVWLVCLDALGRRITDADRRHWAFQPVKAVITPTASPGAPALRNPIDRFIVAQLQTNRLGLAPRATREQLLRRVSFDLTGLPPTIEELDAFVADSAPNAYEKIVDRLLASPHYGERWGRHWLDLARFAETDGFEHDAVRPHSWRYREYVIQSFNADKPYDRFIREQLAGDELFPNDPDARIATGFNLLGPDMVDSADQVQRRLNTLNDMTDTAALVFLGQTLACARCHNHKSEPFSQRDYYRFQAFFATARFQREQPVPTAAERKAHESALASYKAKTGKLQEEIDAIEKPHRDALHAAKLAGLSEEAQLAHRTPKEKRTVEMQNQIQETASLLKVTDGELVKKLSPEEASRRKQLVEKLKRFPKPVPLPMAMALQNSNGAPVKTFVLGRGDYNDPRDEVPPGVPEIFLASPSPSVPPTNAPAASRDSKRRTDLANWIADPENPLTARVMVNRIWQHHFGRGLVRMPSELGTQGEPPSHPELLDWLAREFMAGGWSIKRMHKLILMSEVFQQSSEAGAEALQRDPENRLFSRQNRHRLEGEAIRDSLLLISGQLNPRVGGPSVFPPIPADIIKVSKNWTAGADASDHTRRSVYIFSRRNLRFPFLEVFDAPDSNLSCPERGRSTTAPQSLTLLNSEEVMTAARATAEQLRARPGAADDRMNHAFRLVLGRPPSKSEVELARRFLDSGNSMAAWTEFCRALFNLNAFVYVD
jgi:hypothetical protein